MEILYNIECLLRDGANDFAAADAPWAGRVNVEGSTDLVKQAWPSPGSRVCAAPHIPELQGSQLFDLFNSVNERHDTRPPTRKELQIIVAQQL